DENAEDIFTKITGWRAKLKTIKAEREQLVAKLANNEAEALHSSQELIGLLRSAKGDKRTELRERLKARIRQLVERVDILVWEVSNTVRSAHIQVILRGGNARVIDLAWTHGGKYSGLAIGIGFPAKMVDDEEGTGNLLSDYRTDPKMRQRF